MPKNLHFPKRGGAYALTFFFRYLPYALSVECPADEQTVTPERVRAAQDQLFRQEHCGLETCGWSRNFTVIVTRNSTLEAVQAILHAAGCVIGRQQKIAGGEEAPEGPRHHRQLHGWHVVEPEEVAEPQHDLEPVLLPFERPVTEPRRVNVIVQATREFVAAAAT